MRYEIQWFPKGPKAKYNIERLYKAVRAQSEARDVEKMPTVNYNEWNKPAFPEAVQFTVTGGYPYEIVAQVNDNLMAATKSPEPQGLSVRAVSTIERKKAVVKPKVKKCKCKK